MVNKWDRRDNKRKKKMKVDGTSTKLLWKIIIEKSDRVRQ